MIEHRLGRLVQLGVRQARYFGKRKVAFQVALAAAVANLGLLIDKASFGAVLALLILVVPGLAVLRRLLRTATVVPVPSRPGALRFPETAPSRPSL